MKVTAKADYAVRAVLELAAADGGLVKADRIAEAQGIPRHFLDNILTDLRRAGIVATHRGADGGSRLARPAKDDHAGRRHAGHRGAARRGARHPPGVTVVRRAGRAPARGVDRGAGRVAGRAREGHRGRRRRRASAPTDRAVGRRPGGVEDRTDGRRFDAERHPQTSDRRDRVMATTVGPTTPLELVEAAYARYPRALADARRRSVARSRSPRRCCSPTPTIRPPSASTAASTTPTTGPTASRCRTPPRRWRCCSS